MWCLTPTPYEHCVVVRQTLTGSTFAAVLRDISSEFRPIQIPENDNWGSTLQEAAVIYFTVLLEH
jgi:hypothetical protein